MTQDEPYNPKIADEIAREWVESKEIIKQFLREVALVPNPTEAQIDHNAAALIARLAHANFIIERVKENERHSTRRR